MSGAAQIVRRRLGSVRTKRLVDFLADYGFMVFFVLWVIFLSFNTTTFLTERNIPLLLRQASIYAIPAIGATFVILLGELDISFGSVLGVSGVTAAELLLLDWDPIVAIGAAILVGALVGLINGTLVTFFRIPSVVATLGMLSVVLGIGLVYTDGRAITGPKLDPIDWLAQGYVGIVPIPVVLMFLGYAIAWLVLNRTAFGKHVYLTGDNREAAFRAGISVNRVRMTVFIAAGALAGFGGVVLVSRVSQATASLGDASLFPVLTAVILGGAGLTGGRGRIENTLLASIFLASLLNGLILLGVDAEYQRILLGGILIAAISLDRFRD
jgi:ribose/xylose/arabinose/galactoside ABC-type transport system permease subunit